MFNRVLLVIVGSLLMSACSSLLPPTPNDPYFEPQIPELPTVVERPQQTGAIFSTRNASFLYSDRTASQVGDLITVNLNERTNASKNADTEIKKNDQNSLVDPTLFGRVPRLGSNTLSYDIDSARKFKAEADSAQANSLNGTITVTVAQVLNNGNLVIRGEKWITLNQGNEFIRLSGIIRPEDISTNNSISSIRVANARITYSGTGDLDESNQMGWLSRFFNSTWFPL